MRDQEGKERDRGDRIDNIGFFGMPPLDMTPEERAKWNEINERRGDIIRIISICVFAFACIFTLVGLCMPL